MSKPIPSTPVAPLPPLADLTEQIQSAHRKIVTQQDKFLAETLPHRLTIGFLCLQAHNIFAITAAERGKKYGRGKNSNSRRELLSKKDPKDFKSWLETDLPWLKEPVAYKYIKAYCGLGLDHTSAPTSIPEALAAWEQEHGPATLAALIAANTLQLGKPDKDPEPKQSEFDFFKENASHFREASEIIINMKETLPAEFLKVLSAQTYTTLYELTGTHWSPTDEPPELATIDPAAITI